MKKHTTEHFKDFLKRLFTQMATGDFSVDVECADEKVFTADVIGYDEEFMNVKVRFHNDNLTKLGPIERKKSSFGYDCHDDNETETVWEQVPVKVETISYVNIKLKDTKLKMKLVYDTTDFSDWSQSKYNMTNNEWHKKIWRPFMCDYFIDSHSSVHFSKTENPENIFEEHMNDFLKEFIKDDFVWLEFTN